MSQHPSVVIEADGGSRGNPGPAGYGALLRDAESGDVIAEAATSIGRASNNVAEYRGLIAGLELYQKHTPDALLEVRMDSKLVVEQMAGRWKVKHPDMRPLAISAQRLAPFGTVWTWVPREQNAHADRLANAAMDAAARGEVYVVGQPPTAGRTTAATNPRWDWGGQLGAATTLILLRHGLTDHTVAKRFSGFGGQDLCLNDDGRAQAERAAEAVLADGGADAIVTSSMRRTRETAELMSKALGLPVVVDDGFRECAYGQWDGLTWSEVEERWPDELGAWATSTEVRPPGGESIVEVQARVEESLVDTVATYTERKVVVVSHVSPIRLAVRYCLDAPLASVNRMQVPPGSLTTLSFYASGAVTLRQFSAMP
ncbi:MAG: bifunctional RNase H/acid phosphatase [Nocardioidaceae bacterium]|nr:bifunctional RNase H/acid phosphatase [Nocardioidaceae bacterium]